MNCAGANLALPRKCAIASDQYILWTVSDFALQGDSNKIASGASVGPMCPPPFPCDGTFFIFHFKYTQFIWLKTLFLGRKNPIDKRYPPDPYWQVMKKFHFFLKPFPQLSWSTRILYIVLGFMVIIKVGTQSVSLCYFPVCQDEHPTLGSPASIDLASTFSCFTVTTARETTIGGARWVLWG